MSIPLVTHPGRLGDLIWAMATVRALAGAGRVDFMTSPHCKALAPLLRLQPYIGEVVVNEAWAITGDCPGLQPREPPVVPTSEVYHLGMMSWPEPNLFHYYPLLLKLGYGIDVSPDPNDPWLSLSEAPRKAPLMPSVAFTDEWAELKAGLVMALSRAFPEFFFRLLLLPGSRLATEWTWRGNVIPVECDVVGLAERIAASPFLVACKSMPCVLACGLGVPVVVVEPERQRHNPVFDFPGARNVLFNDFDARGVVAAVRQMVERVK